MATYWLGPREFRSKGAAKDEFRRILKDSPLRTHLQGEDLELMTLLVEHSRHDNLAGKVGVGITSVEVRESRFKNRCFWLNRADGTCVDFSFHTAIDGTAPLDKQISTALRQEITGQIAQYRTEQFEVGVPCGICSDGLTDIDTVHVDHEKPTFKELVEQFTQVVTETGRTMTVECVGAYGRQLHERDLAQVWQIYHQRTAVLRLTHTRCNLSRSRRIT